MELEICSNCGCNITDQDPPSPFVLTIQHMRESDTSPGTFVKVTSTYKLCKCCADGVADLLDCNEVRLKNLHGVCCTDILPYPYRCGHSHVHSAQCTNPIHNCETCERREYCYGQGACCY